MGNNSRLKLLLALETTDRLKELKKLTDEERRKFRHHWRLWARDEQVSPVLDWRLWLILAGRGFGKTRAGAEWVREIADADPAARFALVGASLGDVRAVMVEGESGLIAISPPGKEPQFEPSLRRLQWANGAQATLYSAGEPDSLRGPQHSHAWCDEVAKWENASGRAEKAWDNLLLGLRLGEWPGLRSIAVPRAVSVRAVSVRAVSVRAVSVRAGAASKACWSMCVPAPKALHRTSPRCAGLSMAL